jgi:hypothetical protein
VGTRYSIFWKKDFLTSTKKAVCRFEVVPFPGLPDFSWCATPKNGKNVPNEHTMCQMVIKYPKCKCKIYRHFPIRDPKIFPQIGNFGSKINRLATLGNPFRGNEMDRTEKMETHSISFFVSPPVD